MAVLQRTENISEPVSHPAFPRQQVRFRCWTLALLLAALLFFLNLGDRALWGPEGRWAEVTREMQITGNFFGRLSTANHITTNRCLPTG